MLEFWSMGRTGNLIAALVVIFLAGCGTDAKNLFKGDAGKGKQKPKVCPGAMEPYHQVTAILKSNLPPRVAFELNGKRELDECQPVAEAPPVVLGERDGRKITFSIMHAGAYPLPPANLSFQLINLGDCSGQESVIFGAINLPLHFVTDYPNGATCPGRTFAAMQVFEP
jgi:hypothetical protein